MKQYQARQSGAAGWRVVDVTSGATVTTPTSRSRAQLDAERRNFVIWILEVDRELERLCGATSDGIPDCPWWEWFSAGNAPAVAARKAWGRL